MSSPSKKNKNLFQREKYLNVTNCTRIPLECKNLEKNFFSISTPVFNEKINETSQSNF